MARHEPDKSSKWLIQNYGNSILRLAGASGMQRWKALQAELVQPKQLPDGLLEVFFQGRTKPDYFLIEIASYPEKRILEQVIDDLMLAFQQFRQLPELLTVVLAKRGRLQVPGYHQLLSRLGWSELNFRWKVVELWKMPAEESLALGEVGLVPWITLMDYSGSTEELFERCRKIVEEKATWREQTNLLAVSQVLANLRYDDPELLSILGGKKIMIESPILQKMLAEKMHDAILQVLDERFKGIPKDVTTHIKRIRKEKRLEELLRFAAVCSDIEAFKERLHS